MPAKADLYAKDVAEQRTPRKAVKDHETEGSFPLTVTNPKTGIMQGLLGKSTLRTDSPLTQIGA